MYEVREITAELLGGNGIATEKIKHANLVSFSCLKLLALEDRSERKDAHDLIYCIEHATSGLETSVAKFELGEGEEPEQREPRTLRQRQVSDLVERLLDRIRS